MKPNGVLWRIVHLNPSLFRGAVVAVVALLVSLGIVIAPAVPDQLVTAVVAVAALVQGFWTRDGVTPNDKVLAYAPDPLERPGYVLAGDATTRASDKMILAAVRSDPTGAKREVAESN